MVMDDEGKIFEDRRKTDRRELNSSIVTKTKNGTDERRKSEDRRKK